MEMHAATSEIRGSKQKKQPSYLLLFASIGLDSLAKMRRCFLLFRLFFSPDKRGPRISRRMLRLRMTELLFLCSCGPGTKVHTFLM